MIQRWTTRVLWLVLAAGMTSPVGAQFHVAINEIHYHPADGGASREFVEIVNHGSIGADLDGWVLSGGILYVFPARSFLPPGGFLLVAGDADALAATYDLDPALISGEFDGNLANGGESLELWAAENFLVSFVEYGDADPWPESPDGLGPSLERRSTMFEEGDPKAWDASIVIGGTPGRRNSVFVEPPAGSSSEGQDIIPRGDVWRFLRGTSEPPAEWMAIAFDASAWDSGPAGFGYDDGDDATIFPDMLGGYSTVYVRRAFEVSQPVFVTSLTLEIEFDDGYVAYLNGVEVARRNAPGAPGDPVPHDGEATTFFGDALTDQIDLGAHLGDLVAGTNVLAVQGLNAAIDNPDFTLHPSLRGVISTSSTQNRLFVPGGDEWMYFKGTSAPDANWTAFEFDAGGWDRGSSGFGYGDGDDSTVLDDMQGNYVTVFARREFSIADASEITSLDFHVDYDDGFIAYLNGAEIARRNVQSAEFDQTADGSHEAGAPETFSVSPSLLVDGTNVLGVQGHNASAGSTDFSLLPTLDGVIEIEIDDPNPDPGPLERPARDLVLNELFAGGEGAGWLELYNPTDAEVDVSGRRVLLYPATSGDYSIPAGTTIPARGRLFIDESELGFELDFIQACMVATDDGRLIDSLNPWLVPLEQSTGRFPDGDSNRVVFVSPTPDAANELLEDTRVVINEIMYRPADSSPGGEYIELHNRSGEAVDMSRWSFTRGISFTFPIGFTLEPGGYVVLARDPESVESHYGIAGVLGPYGGRLRNDAETLLLRDANKNVADRVRYADDGGWPETPDGEGPSLELAHPDIENRYGRGWAASDDDGTPGERNSRFRSDPSPIVVGVSQSPVLPAPSDSVRVLATASDAGGVDLVDLLFIADGDGGPPDVTAMRDDGIADDGVAGNDIYGAEIPPRADGTVMTFWFRVESGNDVVSEPPDAPDDVYRYIVEAPQPDRARSLYRIVMRENDLADFRSRNRQSDVLLPLSFVGDGRIYYFPGIRLRGRGARSCDPLSYRVQFSHDENFHGIKRLNMNGCNIDRQWLGLDFLRRTGTATPLTWFRILSFNGDVEDELHLRIESTDEQFLERVFPGDDDGNLYRGEQQANLDYRGEDFDPYRSNYLKRSNEDLDDFSDVIELTKLFDPDFTPDEDFPAAAAAALDRDEWGLYFAAFAILGSTEGGILLDRGDDYFLYHRYSDERWVLLPWDLDSCFDEQNQRLFRPTTNAIERYLEHPHHAPDYWCELRDLLDSAFLPAAINSRIDHVAPLLPGRIREFREFVDARRGYILDRMVNELSVQITSGGSVCDGVLFLSASTADLRGEAPGCGTSEVWVNGSPASYDPQTNEWFGSFSENDGDTLVVTTLYRDGTETGRLELPVLSAQVTAIPGTIDTDTTLSAVGSPYRAGNDVVVASGATLTIESGTELFFDFDARLVVDGALVVAGEPGTRVRFQADDCGERWEGMEIRSGGSADLRWSVLTDADAALRVADGASARLEHITIDSCGIGLALRDGGGGGGSVEAHSLIIWNIPSAVEVDGDSTLDLEHSNTEGLTWPGEGNISADPLFVDESIGDYRLSFYSPSRATGLDRSEMGAFPYEPTGELARFLLGDANGDTIVDVSDVVFTLLYMFRGDASTGGVDLGCELALDVNVDSATNLSDPIFLLSFLFKHGPPPARPFPGCDGGPVERCARGGCP